jgi:hypothetical protein
MGLDNMLASAGMGVERFAAKIRQKGVVVVDKDN